MYIVYMYKKILCININKYVYIYIYIYWNCDLIEGSWCIVNNPWLEYIKAINSGKVQKPRKPPNNKPFGDQVTTKKTGKKKNKQKIKILKKIRFQLGSLGDSRRLPLIRRVGRLTW